MANQIRPLLAACVLLLMVVARASAENWPAARADAARSGFTSEPLPNQLKLRWEFSSRQAPNPAWPSSERMQFDNAFQPIIMGDVVLFGSSADDKLYALDAQTGVEKWSFFTEGPIRFAPVGWQDRVFVASDDGWLYALSLENGKLLWKHRGGPNNRQVFGNGRMISRWPARGGPVVLDDTVYFAAGIWPSDGVYLHAHNAKTGHLIWTNDRTGPLEMAQPHGGARSKSGVSSQGYLLADEQHIFVPTGRAVPAAFLRPDGKLAYYHLQKNQHRGGSRAMLAGNMLCTAGCLFDAASGELASQFGVGATVATPSGVVRGEGKSLASYRWKTIERPDRKGKLVRRRVLEKTRLVGCEREVLDFIIADGDAVCGENGRVCAIDYTRQRNTWWSHEVAGRALGLAYASGRLIVSTDQGRVYCFDGGPEKTSSQTVNQPSKKTAAEIDYAQAVEEIIRRTGVTSGVCIDLGCGGGELALALARRTNLQIIAVDANPENVALARRRLDEAGLYGARVVVHLADPAQSRYAKHTANLVISAKSLTQPVDDSLRAQMLRLQRPYGGQLCTGPIGEMKTSERGALVGAGSWTHQNADPANTICSQDKIVKGPLEMHWFRDGNFQLPNRHGQAPAPLYHDGVMVVGGVNGLCALDAYNGHALWKYELPGNLQDYDGIHHDVGVGEAGSNFCIGGQSVFVKRGDHCVRIDLKTGRKIAEYQLPPPPGEAELPADARWGFLAFSDGLLFGSLANTKHKISPRYQRIKLTTESAWLFAIDLASGKTAWQFQPQHSIRNNSIAIGGGHVFLIDRPLVKADHVANPRRNGRPKPLLKPSEQPSGALLALDAATGKLDWRQPDDIFGTQLGYSQQHNTLIMNYQAVRHNFFKLPSEIGGRIAGFEASTGRRLWDQTANYKSRPLINGGTVMAQDAVWDLATGRPLPLSWERSYGCGQISSSDHLLLFRSGALGYRDLSRQAGTENYGGIRPSCWINAIPAGGLVLVPDGSSKCRCSYQMKAWFALHEKE